MLHSDYFNNLNIGPTTVKGENIGIRFLIINLGHGSLVVTAKTRATKQSKWNYINPSSFCVAKETINKMKNQLAEWEKCPKYIRN